MLTSSPVDTRQTVITGDSRNMQELADASVHLAVTSPPYWQLKDYGENRQIGFHQSYENYINDLNVVWQECHRVLSDGCRLCVNIGDQFARAVYYGRYKVIPIRTEIIRFCETIGFDYMGAIIWQKNTTMNTSGGASVMGSYPYPRNGILKLDYEFILIFKKPGATPPPSPTAKKESILTKEEWHTYFMGHWNFPGARQKQHLAAFPEELPHRLIKMFSFIGEKVLDPFLGSGTTSVVAQELGRSSVGYEIQRDFMPIIRQRLESLPSYNNQQAQFVEGSGEYNRELGLGNLPYIFQDPHGIDKKIDPRTMTFGSKINKDVSKEVPKEEGVKVSKIISPQLLLLSNNVTIRLLGIQEKDHTREEALAFLRNKVLAGKIYLRFDEIKYDDNNNLLCYVYLKNKTFINAHLIKRGLAQVDGSINFSHREKFNRLELQDGDRKPGR